ncbi:MAG: hypothetical protein QM744_14435 [Mesorhizobium sp.]
MALEPLGQILRFLTQVAPPLMHGALCIQMRTNFDVMKLIGARGDLAQTFGPYRRPVSRVLIPDWLFQERFGLILLPQEFQPQALMIINFVGQIVTGARRRLIGPSLAINGTLISFIGDRIPAGPIPQPGDIALPNRIAAFLGTDLTGFLLHEKRNRNPVPGLLVQDPEKADARFIGMNKQPLTADLFRGFDGAAPPIPRIVGFGLDGEQGVLGHIARTLRSVISALIAAILSLVSASSGTV